MTHGADTGIR